MAADDFAHLSLDHVSTVDRVVEEIRRALFEGELGPGTALREVALADSLGVARSTVREALGLLVAEGLADRITHKGTQVRRLDADAVRDVCRARAVIETAGMRRWSEAGQAARDDVRRSLDALAALTAPTRTGGADGFTQGEFTEAHLAVHRAVAALTESPRLVAVADSLYAEVRLALAHVDRTRGNAVEQVHSHVDLVGLLEAGRVEEAVAELADHLAGAEASMLEAIESMG